MPTADCAIARAVRADAPAILALQRLAYQSEARLYGDNAIEPLTQTLESLLAQFDDHVVLKAMCGPELVGSVRAVHQAQTCRVGKLFVAPDRQGRGLGRRLLLAVEEFFPSAGRFELFTGSRSASNLRLYQSLGYRSFTTRTVKADLTLIFLEKPGPGGQTSL